MGLTQPALRGDVVNYKQHDSVERIVLRSKRSWLERTVRNVKALASITFTRSQTWTFGSSGNTSSGGTIDYTERAGDGRGNAIVFAALDLLSTTFAQSPLQIKQVVGDQQNVVSNHELIRRMAKPNDYYSGKLLWKATIVDYSFGNAYWLKVRSGAGKPVQFFWVPSSLITPAWPSDDPTVFISHYDYNPNGTPIKVAVQDVVHFRNGMDPKNIRKGLSPLGALLREIATDEEAAEYVNTILRNLGVAGMVISPATDKGKISTPDAEKIKAQVMQRTSGDRRGEPLVIGGAVNVAAMGQDMSKLDVSALRHLPEERITAIFGTPAVLLGLGTGLENATFSNVDGLRRIFYENKVIPTQGFIASDVHTQLLLDFEANVDAFVVDFDNTEVRVLKEDETQLVDRLLKELESGSMTANEVRAERGREPYPEDMFMLNSRIIPVAVTDIIKKATVADATQNGSGTATSGDTGAGNGGSGNGGSDGGTGIGSGDTGGTGNSANSDGNKSAVPATKDIGDSVTRIRARMNAQCRRDVQAFLAVQRDFVLAQVGDNKARTGGTTKVRVNWPRLQEDIDSLRGTLEPWYKRVLVAVHDVVQDVLDTRYELSSTDERTYLKSAALNIRGINEYTRSAVADAIALSVALDESQDELATRIKGLHVFSDERAMLIAGVELATATNLAQIESYKASDVVVGMLITDGDQDNVCRALDGTKVKIAEARSIPPLGHPNCVRRFWHITDASEMNEAA